MIRCVIFDGSRKWNPMCYYLAKVYGVKMMRERINTL